MSRHHIGVPYSTKNALLLFQGEGILFTNSGLDNTCQHSSSNLQPASPCSTLLPHSPHRHSESRQWPRCAALKVPFVSSTQHAGRFDTWLHTQTSLDQNTHLPCCKGYCIRSATADRASSCSHILWGVWQCACMGHLPSECGRIYWAAWCSPGAKFFLTA